MRDRHALAAPLAWAILYLLLAYPSHALNGAFIASGHLWLPAGVSMGALLLTPSARWFPLLVLLVAAQVLLGWIEQRELWRTLLLALDEVGVAALAVWLARRSALPLQGPRFVGRLLLLALGASVASGLLGAAWFSQAQGLPFWATLRAWSMASLVGILVVTPLLIAWIAPQGSRLRDVAGAQWRLGLAAFVALLVSGWLAFDSRLDLLLLDIDFATTYLPLLCVVLVASLWGEAGGALAVASLALIAFVCNSLGRGPFVELAQLHASNALLELQLYLAVAALLSLLVGALKRRA